MPLRPLAYAAACGSDVGAARGFLKSDLKVRPLKALAEALSFDESVAAQRVARRESLMERTKRCLRTKQKSS